MAARYDKLTKCKRQIKAMDDHNKRLSLIWGWAKSDGINFSEFKQLIDYLDVVDDEKDREFTQAALQKNWERRQELLKKMTGEDSEAG